MRSLAEMELELANLQAQVKAKREEVKGETIDAIKLMLDSGTLTADDLLALLPANVATPARKRDNRRPAKYRDPDSGQTWTGQGAMPNWIKGKNADDFLIKQGA